MKKERINSLLFFIILQVLVFYLLYRGNHIELNPLVAGIFTVLLILLVVLSKPMVPIFKGILFIFGKVGSIIFKVLSGVVFFLILTPIALILRITGKVFVCHKFEHELDTYFQDFKSSPEIEKQF